MNDTRIEKLMVEAYEVLLQNDKEVYIEDIVQKIDDWGACDGFDYWKEVPDLNLGTESSLQFEETCKYVEACARYGCHGKLEEILRERE